MEEGTFILFQTKTIAAAEPLPAKAISRARIFQQLIPEMRALSSSVRFRSKLTLQYKSVFFLRTSGRDSLVMVSHMLSGKLLTMSLRTQCLNCGKSLLELGHFEPPETLIIVIIILLFLPRPFGWVVQATLCWN